MICSLLSGLALTGDLHQTTLRQSGSHWSDACDHNTEVTAAHPDQVTCPGHTPTRDHWSPALTLWPIILSSGSGLALELQSSVDQGCWPGEENTAGVSQCGGCVSQSEVRTQSREFVSTNQRPAAAEQGPLLCRFRYMTIDSRTQFLI